MLTLMKGNKVIKLQNDKYILDAFIADGYVVIPEQEQKPKIKQGLK